MDENSLKDAQIVCRNRFTNQAAGDDVNNAQNDISQYTLPGVLHFIDNEWQRFQAERIQWDADRAELQVSRWQ